MSNDTGDGGKGAGSGCVRRGFRQDESNDQTRINDKKSREVEGSNKEYG